MEFRVYQDTDGWHWEAVSSSGAPLVTSSPYPTEAECRTHLEEMRKRIDERSKRDE